MRHHRHAVLEPHSEFVCQGRVSAAEHVPGEPWHLQIPANGLQSACRDTVLADRRTGLRHEDEVIGPSKFRPLAQSEQNGEQRLWNWQISVAAFPAHAAQLTAVRSEE